MTPPGLPPVAMPRIVNFLPTPLTASGEVDRGQLAAVARRVGRHGIMPAVLGGMGEFFALNLAESRACMEAAVDGAGSTPVVAGIGFSTREAVMLAEMARNAGVSVLVVNPHYYAVPTPTGLAEHVRRITEASGLAAIVYSSATHPLTDRHVDELASVPGLRGIKEEAYPVEEFARRVGVWGDRIEWWAVTEPVGMPFVEAGARVVTSSMANAAPGASREYVRASLTREGVGGLVADLADAWEDFVSSAPEGAPGALKAMMHLLDGWRLDVRAPLVAAGPATLRAAAALLEEFEAVLDAEPDKTDPPTSRTL